MHGRRILLAAVLAGGSTLLSSTVAVANGGSYIEFDQTHYVPGDAGVATTTVSVPRRKAGLIDRGPFYLFAIPEGMLREDRPIPEAAIRLATFSIQKRATTYDLRAEFVAPQLESRFYFMGLCNDPCTLAGFGEPLIGSVSIVATRREGELLTRNETLRIRLLGARGEARRAERRLEKVRGELETQLAFVASEHERTSSKIERLETQLAAARERAAGSSARVPFDPWVVGGILLVTLVAAVLAFRRRRMLPAITDL